jgi:hypothetical protein
VVDFISSEDIRHHSYYQDLAKRDEAAVAPAKGREGIWLETWILAWQGKMIADGLRWWERLFNHIQHYWMYDAASFSQLLGKLGSRQIKACEMNQGSLPALNCLDIPSRQAESFYT